MQAIPPIGVSLTAVGWCANMEPMIVSFPAISGFCLCPVGGMDTGLFRGMDGRLLGEGIGEGLAGGGGGGGGCGGENIVHGLDKDSLKSVIAAGIGVVVVVITFDMGDSDS